MSFGSTVTVRVGVLVTRYDSEYIPFRYSMFHIRQRLDGQMKMKVDETRRYWVHMTMSSYCDYWGEWDSDVEIHKAVRAK